MFDWCKERLSGIGLRIRAIARREQLERDLEDEIAFHLAERAARLNETSGAAQGGAKLGAADAESAAKRQFGNATRLKEECRDEWSFPSIESLWQDVRYAARMLRKNPAFTAIAVLTLALGIGANTAVFSVVHAVLLEPLPYPHPEQLVTVWEKVRLEHYQDDQDTPAPGNFTDWKNGSTAFTGMAAIRQRNATLTGAGEPVRIGGEGISASMFSILQTSPELGRAFTEAEELPGAPHVAIISHALWAERFSSDPGIVGRAIVLDSTPYTVVGVMPRGFHFPDPDDDVWVPLGLTPAQLANHDSHYLRIVARLRDGVPLATAQAQLDAIAARLTAQFPDTNTGVGVNIIPLVEHEVGDVRPALKILLGAVGLVLLIVCANVANLLLARSAVRQREIALRAALGASRGRILRQLLTESVLLAAIGGGLGMLLAYWGVRVLPQIGPGDLPRMSSIGVNGPVLAFSFCVSILAGLIFGVAPALEGARSDVHDALKDGGQGRVAGGRARMRGLLIVAEMALSVVVLVGAGLLLRSFVLLEQIPLGFNAENMLTFGVSLPAARYGTYPQRAAFYHQVQEKIQALPGVRSVAGISYLPLTFAGRTSVVLTEGSAPVPMGQLPFVDYRSVTPRYFETMRVPMIAGRDVAGEDATKGQLVAVVSEAMARSLWPNQDAIGKRFKLSNLEPSDPWFTVIGVVGNVRQLSRTKEPRPGVYLLADQDSGTDDTVHHWAVRASGDPLALAAAVRSAVWSVDRDLPVGRLRTMETLLSRTVAGQQFNLLLLGMFATMALVLAVVGLYGVTAYSVAERTREIGVRMALGAEPGTVSLMFVRRGARLATAGLAIGLAAALAASRGMTTMLYGIAPADPVTFAGVALLLIVVALAACYLPARRATRVDPFVALRQE